MSLTLTLFKDSLLTAKNRIPARRVSVDFPTHTACAVTTVPICVKMSDKRGMLPLHPAAASEIKGCASAVLGVWIEYALLTWFVEDVRAVAGEGLKWREQSKQ